MFEKTLWYAACLAPHSSQGIEHRLPGNIEVWHRTNNKKNIWGLWTTASYCTAAGATAAAGSTSTQQLSTSAIWCLQTISTLESDRTVGGRHEPKWQDCSKRAPQCTQSLVCLPVLPFLHCEAVAQSLQGTKVISLGSMGQGVQEGSRNRHHSGCWVNF